MVDEMKSASETDEDLLLTFLAQTGSESFIGWNLNQPNGHAIIKYWFIQEWSSWGTSTGSHAINEFQKLQPISESRPPNKRRKICSN